MSSEKIDFAEFSFDVVRGDSGGEKIGRCEGTKKPVSSTLQRLPRRCAPRNDIGGGLYAVGSPLPTGVCGEVCVQLAVPARGL